MVSIVKDSKKKKHSIAETHEEKNSMAKMFRTGIVTMVKTKSEHRYG